MQTIMSMTNAMMGGPNLVLPLIFNDCGYISSSVILALVGFISFKTANIYVTHMKAEESDVSDAVKRILGKGWWAVFIILSCSMLLLLVMIYYMLMNDMIYKISQFIFYHAEFENYAHKDDFTFSRFSMTYVSLF
jgi:sodium-coupled neutral amino acid transporter 9